MDILLLGPVEVRQGLRRVDIGHAKQRCVLAALSVEARRTVPIDELIDRVWSGAPPDRARQTMQAYVSRLRRALGAVLRYWGGGYVLEIGDGQVDLLRFRALIAMARGAAGRGDAAGAAVLFGEALGMWRGDALGGLDGHWAEGVRARMAEERFAALEDRVDADLNLGRHAGVVGELSALVREYPWRERIVAQLMIALYRDGRQSDALHLYRVVRTRLAGDGLRPGPGLRLVEESILRADARLFH